MVTRLTFQAWRSLLRELLSVVAYAQCDGRLLSTQGLAGILCSMHPRSGGRKAYPRHRATCCPGRTGCARMVQTRAFSVSREICWRRRWARALPRKPQSGMCAGHENKLASHFDCQDSREGIQSAAISGNGRYRSQSMRSSTWQGEAHRCVPPREYGHSDETWRHSHVRPRPCCSEAAPPRSG
jgi:hypothetical protein